MAYRKAQDTKGLRAVFYARVSTAEEEQLNAIELQIEENRNTIIKHGWKKVDEYIDRSKSGTMVKGRDEYQRLYEDLLGDAFDVVVIKDQERLMRNTLDWYLFINRLVQTGKILYMYLDNKFYSPDDALITGIKAIIAEEFSRNLSKKLHNYHDGRIEKARQGLEIDLQGSGNVFGLAGVTGGLGTDSGVIQGQDAGVGAVVVVQRGIQLLQNFPMILGGGLQGHRLGVVLPVRHLVLLLHEVREGVAPALLVKGLLNELLGVGLLFFFLHICHQL